MIDRSQSVASARLTLTVALFVLLLAAIFAAQPAKAAYQVTNYSLNATTTAASGHPTLGLRIDPDAAAADSTGGDDLKQFAIRLPVGMQLDPSAIDGRCATAQFALNLCPTTAIVGSSEIRWRGPLGLRLTSEATVVALSSTTAGSVLTLGLNLRTPFFRQVQLKLEVSGTPANGMSISAGAIPRQLRVLLLNLPLDVTADEFSIQLKSLLTGGGHFITNPTTCAASASTLDMTTYAGLSLTRSEPFSATGCPIPDTSPPDTAILSGPSGPTTEQSATFEFSSDEANSTFQCRLLGSAGDSSFEPCQSPKQFSSLSDGDHTFEVRAVDTAGNIDPTPAQRSFAVAPVQATLEQGELTVADESSDSPRANTIEVFTEGDSVMITDTASEFTSAPTGCSLVDIHTIACPTTEVSSITISGGAGDDTIVVPAAINAVLDGGEGDDTLVADYDDILIGGPGNDVLNAGPGDDQLDGGTGDDLLIGGTGSDEILGGDGNDQVVAHDGEADLIDCGQDTDSASLDGANDGVPTGCESVADRPDIEIVSGPLGGVTADITPEFEFTTSYATDVRCSIDGGAFFACQSPVTTFSLADGAHSFAVQAFSPIGEVEELAVEMPFVVDTASPVITFDAPAVTVSSASFEFVYQVTDAIDASPDCSVPSGTTMSLVPGETTLSVTCLDDAGNSATATQTVTFVPAPPTANAAFSSLAQSTPATFTSEVTKPDEGANLRTIRWRLPVFVDPHDEGLSSLADQCPSASAPNLASTFDPSNCPPASIVGTVTMDIGGQAGSVTGNVHLIGKIPIPWLGIDVQPSIAGNPSDLFLRMKIVTSYPLADPQCNVLEEDCLSRIQLQLDNIPDIEINRFAMTLGGVPRTSGSGSPIDPNPFEIMASCPYDPETAPAAFGQTEMSVTQHGGAVTAIAEEMASGCETPPTDGPPNIEILTPLDGTTTEASSASLSYVVTDESATPPSCNRASPSNVPLNLGPNVITVDCADAAGNIGTASVTVTRLADQPPTVSIQTPEDQSFTRSGTVVLTYLASDASGIEPTCDQVSGSTVPLLPGPNVITVACMDGTGNSGSDSVVVTFDEIPPTVTITSPSDGLIIPSTEVAVMFTASDDTGGGVTCDRASGAFHQLSPGANTISVSCTDQAGNSTTASVTVQSTGAPVQPPTVDSLFSSLIPSDPVTFDSEVVNPTGNPNLKSIRWLLPAFVDAYVPGILTGSNECPSTSVSASTGIFDPSSCPDMSILGSMELDVGGQPDVVRGDLYAITRTPIPWFGVDVNPTIPGNPAGLTLRWIIRPSFPLADPACDVIESECISRIQLLLSDLPDIEISRFKLTLGGIARTTPAGVPIPPELFEIYDPCPYVPEESAANFGATVTSLVPHSGSTKVITEDMSSGCVPG